MNFFLQKNIRRQSIFVFLLIWTLCSLSCILSPSYRTPTPFPTLTPTTTPMPTLKSAILGHFVYEYANQIWSINADGSKAIKLTESITESPKYSPDGRRIIYLYNEDIIRADFNIFIMNSYGSDQRQLTYNGPDVDPAFSTDGKKIAYASYTGQIGPDYTYSIFVMNADGSGKTQITIPEKENEYLVHRFPYWSQDNSRIAFLSNNENTNFGDWHLFIVNVDGTGKVEIPNPIPDMGDVVWSPDLNKIAFVSNKEGNSEIYVMSTDGTGLMNLTNHPSADLDPAWSTDGTKIVFVSTRDGFYEIYVMEADGSAVTQITHDHQQHRNPDWTFH